MRASSACASSSRNDSRQVRVDLEGVAQSELPVRQPGLLGERLVQQLADRHRVGGVHSVRGGQVVVLAGVDDDPGPGVHLAGESLVHEGPDRVDVPEQDPVHRVVEHHVQPVQPGQGGDLRHAQPGCVVGQPHVPADLAADLVQSRPHQPEVLAGGVGAGVALPGGALRHVVEQALPGRADHRDHVRPGPRGGLRLRDVLVDVAGGHDQVDPGPARRVAEAVDQPLTPGPGPVDPAHPRRHRHPGRPTGPLGVPPGRDPEGDPAAALPRDRRLLRQGEQVGGLAPAQGVPHRQRDAVLQPYLGPDRVGQVVHPGHPVRVRPGQAGQAQRRPLHRDRAVGPGKADDGPDRAAGQPARGPHRRRVQLYRGNRRHGVLRSGVSAIQIADPRKSSRVGRLQTQV